MAISMQTAYSTTFAKGSVGQIANEEKYNAVSRTVETTAGISFGQPAFRGSGDHGAVLGAAFAATGTGSAGATNVGTSTITASPTITAGAQQGRYVVTQLATSATGALVVTAPDGQTVGHGVVGTAITTVPGITSFTVTSGGTATIGDQFYIDVAFTANASFIGLAVKTIAPEGIQNGGTAITDGYPRYATGSFMTSGTMYVMAGASVADGDAVYWNQSTGRYTNTTTHIRIPGAYFDTTSTDGNLVEVSIGNRRVA